jgi:putative restriction endonuclease
MITDYKTAFAKLSVDKVSGRWGEETNHGAPYKPFLLLAIMDLIAQGEITTNFIQLNAELLDTFTLYWDKVMGQDKWRNPVLPFYHLKSEGFWYLQPVPGMEQALATSSHIRSFKQLERISIGATFDEALFEQLQDPQTRDALRQVLIETYFAPDTRPLLVEVGEITAQSFAYSRELLNRSRGAFKIQEISELDQHYHSMSRSAGFRRLIVNAYNHTCAVCKIRLVTPEGYTAVSAAHIVPWSASHNDDPRNGMALCGTHHWAFDRGILGITTDYTILVSPIVAEDDALSQPLRELHDQQIHLPSEPSVYPAKQALRWHTKHIYRDTIPPRLL